MNKSISIIALGLILTPSWVFASWWNPITWFKKEVPTPIIEVQPEIKKEVKIVPEEDLKSQITELKKQIIKMQKEPKVIKETVITPVVTEVLVTDKCPNIEGVQKDIPEGRVYSKTFESCVTLDGLDKLEEKMSEKKREENKQNELNSSLNKITEKMDDLRSSYLVDLEYARKTNRNNDMIALQKNLLKIYYNYLKENDVYLSQYRKTLYINNFDEKEIKKRIDELLLKYRINEKPPLQNSSGSSYTASA